MVFTPVHVRSTCLAGAIDHMRRVDFVEHSVHPDLVLHSHAGGMDVFVLSTEKVIEVAGNPAVLAPYQVSWLHDDLF